MDCQQLTIQVKDMGWRETYKNNYEISGQGWNFKLYLQDSSGSRSPPPSSNTTSSPEGEAQLEMVWCQNKEKIPPSLLASEFKLLID